MTEMYVYINETGKNRVFRTVNNAVTDNVCVRKKCHIFSNEIHWLKQKLRQKEIWSFSPVLSHISILEIIS